MYHTPMKRGSGSQLLAVTGVEAVSLISGGCVQPISHGRRAAVGGVGEHRCAVEPAASRALGTPGVWDCIGSGTLATIPRAFRWKWIHTHIAGRAGAWLGGGIEEQHVTFIIPFHRLPLLPHPLPLVVWV